MIGSNFLTTTALGLGLGHFMVDAIKGETAAFRGAALVFAMIFLAALIVRACKAMMECR